MKNKNIISSILLSTLILSFSLKADEENIDKIFKENIPAKSTGRGKKVLLFLGASSAALATGIGGALVMKFKKDKDLKHIREELEKELDIEHLLTKKALDDRDYALNQFNESQAKEKRALQDFVKVESQRRELETENKQISQQLNEILHKDKMKEVARVLRPIIEQCQKDYTEKELAPLREEIAELSERITLREQNAKNLKGEWLEKSEKERAEFSLQLEGLNDVLQQKEQELSQSLKVTICDAGNKFTTEYIAPDVIKDLVDELAELELKEFVMVG